MSSPEQPDICTATVSRDELASFLMRNKERVFSIARHWLRDAPRNIADSDDVVSSVLRRLDQYMTDGHLRQVDENSLWGLVAVFVRNEAIAKTRFLSRALALQATDGDYARLLADRLQACAGSAEASRLMQELGRSLDDARDREIFKLRMRGFTHNAIAAALGCSVSTVQQLWSSIKDRLTAELERRERSQ